MSNRNCNTGKDHERRTPENLIDTTTHTNYVLICSGPNTLQNLSTLLDLKAEARLCVLKKQQPTNNRFKMQQQLETTRDRSACTCEDMLCTNDEWQWSIARINLKSLHSATNGEQVKKKAFSMTYHGGLMLQPWLNI